MTQQMTIQSAQNTQNAARAFLRAGGNYYQRQDAIKKLEAAQAFLTKVVLDKLGK